MGAAASELQRGGARGPRMRDRLRARSATLAEDGRPTRPRLGDLVGDALVRAVVPRYRDERGLAEVQRSAQDREELSRGRHGESRDAEGPRELDESGIAERGRARAPVDPLLVGLDNAQAIIHEDHADDRGSQTLRGLELLDVHEKPAVAREGDY